MKMDGSVISWAFVYPTVGFRPYLVGPSFRRFQLLQSNQQQHGLHMMRCWFPLFGFSNKLLKNFCEMKWVGGNKYQKLGNKTNFGQISNQQIKKLWQESLKPTQTAWLRSFGINRMCHKWTQNRKSTIISVFDKPNTSKFKFPIFHVGNNKKNCISPIGRCTSTDWG